MVGSGVLAFDAGLQVAPGHGGWTEGYDRASQCSSGCTNRTAVRMGNPAATPQLRQQGLPHAFHWFHRELIAAGLCARRTTPQPAVPWVFPVALMSIVGLAVR